MNLSEEYFAANASVVELSETQLYILLQESQILKTLA